MTGRGPKWHPWVVSCGHEINLQVGPRPYDQLWCYRCHAYVTWYPPLHPRHAGPVEVEKIEAETS